VDLERNLRLSARARMHVTLKPDGEARLVGADSIYLVTKTVRAV
jgi:hypothetical protein